MKYAIHNTQYSIRNKHHSKRSTLPAVVYPREKLLWPATGGSASSTSVEKSLQTHSILINKPNVKIDKINLSLIVLKGYEGLWLIFGSIRAKNKPNSKPIKPNQTQSKPNFSTLQGISKPIQTQANPFMAVARRRKFWYMIAIGE
jgi:hypothetical protein